MTGEYETKYDGQLSYIFRPLTIDGAPLSGRTTTINYSYSSKTKQATVEEDGNISINAFINKKIDEIKRLDDWKEKIRRKIKERREEEYVPSVPGKMNFFKNYNLHITFFLFDDKNNETEHNRYRDMDLDNLLKPVLDALKESRLIEDDRYFKGIRVQKEPVSDKAHQGIEIECVTTKTFKIIKVTTVKGYDLMPGYWRHDMQFIEAEDEEGERGLFVDNVPGSFFRGEKNNSNNDSATLSDVIPGYKWENSIDQEVSGCIILKRKYSRPVHPMDKTFLWLKKWT